MFTNPQQIRMSYCLLMLQVMLQNVEKHPITASVSLWPDNVQLS